MNKLIELMEKMDKTELRDFLKDLKTLTDDLSIALIKKISEPNKELLFDGVACPNCNKLLLPTEDELKDGWAYGTCCFCGAKLPILHKADSNTISK